jgi:hypothetical protein
MSEAAGDEKVVHVAVEVVMQEEEVACTGGVVIWIRGGASFLLRLWQQE